VKILTSPFFRLLVLLPASLTLAASARAAVSVTGASGGGSISADTAANATTPAWTSLGSITIAEPSGSKGDIGGGTLILKAPAGFEFNPTPTPSIAFTAGRNITAASIAATDSTTLTVTLSVTGSNSADKITIGETTPVRVRSIAGTPLPTGNIYRPTPGGGTAVIAGITATANTDGSGGTSFGALREVAGAARQLALQTAPPAAVTAGAVFSPQPILLVQDQFGNTRNTANGSPDNTTVVNVARTAGSGALQGTTNVTSANGAATFSNLWHNKAETITVVFSSGSLTNVVTDNIIVNPAPLTVRPNDLIRTYGATNLPLTVSYTGFIPGETLETSGVTGNPVVSTTAQTDSPAGVYPITASLGTLAAQNYTFIFAGGLLTVVQASLTVAANNVLQIYGATNPVLTVTYTGFVLGQDSSVLSGSPSVTTSAGTNSPVGSYPIVVTAGSLTSPNYAFTFVNGTLSVVPAGTLFMDDFTRSTDPGPLAPWVAQAGNWSVTGGMLASGTNALSSYSYIYLTNTWTDYSAQALIKLSPGAYGGGLATRLNSATGARYAAWVYPEGSPGGSSGLKLLKFQNWVGFTVMQQANLPGVGTNWHTLKLVAQGNRLAAHYDGSLVLSWTDPDAQPLLTGGISLEMWTAAAAETLSADDVLVTLPGGVVVSNDTYTVREADTLSVPAPGVLANDATEMGGLTALLGTGPAHGTLSLNTNGGFTYVPVVSYVGTDTFTYRAQDGYSTSGVATVTITVTPNRAPIATNDSYTLMADTTLTVPAPGILTNDSDADGDSLTAVLATGPTKGTLSLSPNGAFIYVPAANYVGTDSFTYQASDGLTNSGLATVTITVTTFTPLYGDTFTRTTLSPWVVQAGNWAVSGGVLKGGTNEPSSYGYAYLTNQWSDYSVQGRVQFSAGGFGGGLDGRLNPATGARYAAWIYPEGSPGGSSVLKLLKFQNWSQFAMLQQVSLAGVGTNWHNLKLVMQDNRIAVHYDGTLMLSLTDPAPQPLLSGGISFDLWTDATPWTLTADDVAVNPVRNVLATNDSYTVRMAGTLTVPPAGVLTNDAGELGPLTAVLATNASHGTLTLNPNGGFTYAPVSTYSGLDSFAYRATDGLNTSSPATVTITIPANRGPTAANDSYTLTMNSTLTVAAPGILANDADPDGDPLRAVLVSHPGHGILILSTNGGFSYAPALGYTGSDSFTYQAGDGLTNSSLATVTLSVAAPGPLFTDDFTRTNPPGALSPWVVRAGNWTVNGGLLQGGTNSPYTYGYAYLTNNWTDYEAQARIQLPSGAFGGGLAGRLNTATGARYATWIYPEGSNGGSVAWKLLKFQNWDSFTVMQQGSLPGVGTNWHSLRLAFQGNRINLYYDGTQLTSTTDPQPYLSGGLSIDLWTDAAAYVLAADDVQVTALAPDVSVTAIGIAPDLSNRTVTVTFQGAPGGLYVVQATTNLASPISWLTVSTNLAGGNGRWTYTDSLTNSPRRYYRAARADALVPDVSVTAIGIAPDLSNRTVTVTFQGAPGWLYLVQAATNLASPISWLTVSTNLAGGDGRWAFTDSLTNLPQRYYRAARP
jgi:hypothetical protein